MNWFGFDLYLDVTKMSLACDADECSFQSEPFELEKMKMKQSPFFLFASLLAFRMGNSWGIAWINQVEGTDESYGIVFWTELKPIGQTLKLLPHWWWGEKSNHRMPIIFCAPDPVVIYFSTWGGGSVGAQEEHCWEGEEGKLLSAQRCKGWGGSLICEL